MIVIKYGGHALPEPGKTDPIISLISEYIKGGRRIALVHGGGPQINAELAVHGIASEFFGGYRVTTPEIFSVVQKVLSGDVLRTLVNQFVSHDIKAVGLSAGDGNLTRARKMRLVVDGVERDIGLVGEIAATDPEILIDLLSRDFFPIISPVSVDANGQGLNLNADLVAGAIGGALKADQVIFMTDVAGIYRSYPDPTSLISNISCAELKSLLPTFSDGMIPKAESAIAAIEAGAKLVRIIDGRDVENLRMALNDKDGTEVRA